MDQNTAYTPPIVSGVASPATGYTYDADGGLTVVTRPDGGTLQYGYDATTGRLSTITHPRGVSQYTYWTTPQGSASYPSGQLKTATSADGVTCTYAYDGPLLSSETWSGAVTGVVEYRHDMAFRDSAEKVVVGAATREVLYAYDADGLLTRASGTTGGWVYDLHRADSTGVVDSTHVGSGAGTVTSSASYDGYGELTDLHYSLAGSPLYHEHLQRNVLGQITRIEERWGAGALKVSTYGYDLAGRLDSVAVDGVVMRRYSYDANGNRTQERGVNGLLLANGVYDDQDRLLSYGNIGEPVPPGLDSVSYVMGATYEWSAAGELLRRTVNGGSESRYRYDALGNLTGARVPGGDTLTYIADGQDRRVALKRNGTLERQWLYGGAIPPLAELDGTGALLHRYVYATLGHSPDLLVDGDSTTVYRMVTDHLGSVRAVVRTSDGAMVQRSDHDAWGGVTASVNAPFQSLGYAGGLTDRSTGLVRFGARDYDPEVGRWTAKDPIGFAGGDANVYAYVTSMPTGIVDESGRVGAPPLDDRGDGAHSRNTSEDCIDDNELNLWTLVGMYGDARELRSHFQQAYPQDDRERHKAASAELARRYGAANARVYGLLNEVQGGLLHDLPRLRSRLRNGGPWAFEVTDLAYNEIGYARVQRAGPQPCGCKR